jgi:hypothetical protein
MMFLNKRSYNGNDQYLLFKDTDSFLNLFSGERFSKIIYYPIYNNYIEVNLSLLGDKLVVGSTLNDALSLA